MRGAIFDLDGTLLDSMSIWQEQIECFVRSKGVTPPENLINMTKTLGTAQAIVKIIEWFHLEDDPQEALAQFEKIMFRYYQRSLPLKPHALDYLQTLQSAHIPMVIATATAQPLVAAALKRLQIADYFQFVLTVGDVGVGKEDPTLFLTCAQRLNLPPEDCTVFEDSLTALQTARKAGFHTVAVEENTAYLEKADILTVAERYITGFEQLL